MNICFIFQSKLRKTKYSRDSMKRTRETEVKSSNDCESFMIDFQQVRREIKTWEPRGRLNPTSVQTSALQTELSRETERSAEANLHKDRVIAANHVYDVSHAGQMRDELDGKVSPDMQQELEAYRENAAASLLKAQQARVEEAFAASLITNSVATVL